MGKRSKQGAALRAKKRANLANLQLQQSITTNNEEQLVQSKKDDDLFILDTTRNDTLDSTKALSKARRTAEEKEALKKRKYSYSTREQSKINKMLKVHGKDGVIALANEGQVRMEKSKRIVKSKQKYSTAAKPTFDLWGEPSTAAVSTSKSVGTKNKQKTETEPPPPQQLSNKQIRTQNRIKLNSKPQLAVEVAHPGQSYHPDKEHHQDAIGNALSIEIRRNEAVEYKKKPISDGMSLFTKEFIVGSSDDSESEEEEESSDEEEEDTKTTTAKIIKRKEKLTRAQRNKQKRVKAEQTSLKARKTHKQFLHQANEVHIHNKSIKKLEKEHIKRQSEISKLKQEKKSIPLGKDVWTTLSSFDPIRAPALPVALSSELQGGNGTSNSSGGGGLRTVIPKGSLVTDRLESMVARNMISKKKLNGRRVVQGKRRLKRVGEKGTEYLLI